MKLALRMKAAVSAVSSLFGATRAGMTTPVSGGWGWLREPFAGAWQRGISADPVGELTAFGAVFACISRIATDIAKLRLMLMAQQASGIWQEVLTASPFWPALRKPNAYQTRIQFLMAWMISKLIFGNTYVLKVRDLRGIVVQMHVLDPHRVTPLVTMEGDVYYQLGRDDLAGIGDVLIVPAREIIHDRGATLFHPLIGVSPLYACGIAATQGRRIQGNSAKFFENMSRPSGMLTAPSVISQATADRLKEEWEKNYSGDNLGRLAVLGDGLKYEAMTIPPEQAQMVEQLGWTVEDVARCFGVPLYKINAGAVPTSNNVEALDQQYYVGCLQIHIESIELCLDEGLALPPGLGVELDLDGLLRMDTATLVESLAKAVGGAIMAPDEARRRLNLPPVPGGASVYLQQQNYSLEALAKRDAKEDPFGTAKADPAPALPPPAAAAQPESAKALLEIAQERHALALQQKDYDHSTEMARLQAEADQKLADERQAAEIKAAEQAEAASAAGREEAEAAAAKRLAEEERARREAQEREAEAQRRLAEAEAEKLQALAAEKAAAEAREAEAKAESEAAIAKAQDAARTAEQERDEALAQARRVEEVAAQAKARESAAAELIAGLTRRFAEAAHG